MEWSGIDNGLLDPMLYLGTGYHAAFTQPRNGIPSGGFGTSATARTTGMCRMASTRVERNW
jgi:hypothetical protein